MLDNVLNSEAVMIKSYFPRKRWGGEDDKAKYSSENIKCKDTEALTLRHSRELQAVLCVWILGCYKGIDIR